MHPMLPISWWVAFSMTSLLLGISCMSPRFLPSGISVRLFCVDFKFVSYEYSENSNPYHCLPLLYLRYKTQTPKQPRPCECDCPYRGYWAICLNYHSWFHLIQEVIYSASFYVKNLNAIILKNIPKQKFALTKNLPHVGPWGKSWTMYIEKNIQKHTTAYVQPISLETQ